MPFLADRLAKTRKELGLNQVEFAAFLIRHGAPHITKATINNWESGTRPRDIFFDVIRQATGHDANFFYGDDLNKQFSYETPRRRTAAKTAKAAARRDGRKAA